MVMPVWILKALGWLTSLGPFFKKTALPWFKKNHAVVGWALALLFLLLWWGGRSAGAGKTEVAVVAVQEQKQEAKVAVNAHLTVKPKPCPPAAKDPNGGCPQCPECPAIDIDFHGGADASQGQSQTLSATATAAAKLNGKFGITFSTLSSPSLGIMPGMGGVYHLGLLGGDLAIGTGYAYKLAFDPSAKTQEGIWMNAVTWTP